MKIKKFALLVLFLAAWAGLLNQFALQPAVKHTPKSPKHLPKSGVTTETNTNVERQSQRLGSGQYFSSTKILDSAQALPPPNYATKIGSHVSYHGTSFPLRTYHILDLPNDPNASQPWVSSANISGAWAIPRGNQPTLLAIVDTGFALQHEELRNRWYINPGESGPATAESPSRLNCTDRGLVLDQSCNLIDDDGNGIVDDESGPTTLQNPSRLNCTDKHKPLTKDCNLIDDDGNGLVDDIQGWDFAHMDNSAQAGEANPNETGGHHGTYVSSVAAASGNNGVGIAGVDWGTTILPIQALEDAGSGYNSAVANGILYAADKHADVISLSLGTSLSDPVVRDAVQTAIAKGSIVVAAAGNDGCNCMSYPANYPEVIAVGALATNGQPAGFSSFGTNLDVMAPGVNLTTADWQPSNPVSAYATGISGTSLATPVVSGLLTRLKSLAPSATPLQLIAALTENTNRLTLPAGQARSDNLGFGEIDGGRASQRLTTSHSPTQLYAFAPLSLGNKVSPASPAEPVDNSQAYQCDNGQIGSTPIYELLKSGISTFSASTIEKEQSLEDGYTASIFDYACLSEPNDNPVAIRTIDLHNEARNLALSK